MRNAKGCPWCGWVIVSLMALLWLIWVWQTRQVLELPADGASVELWQQWRQEALC